jgi:hypothetical protein
MMIILSGIVAILGKKIKNRANYSAVLPQQHPQQQGYNSQADNDNLLNDMSIVYVTIVTMASIFVPAFLIGQNIIPPHPFFLVNTVYGMIYVPSLVLPITFAINQPISIKIGIQAFPCCN